MDFWHIVALLAGIVFGTVLQAITNAHLHAANQKVTFQVVDDYHRQLVALKTEVARLQKLV